MSHIEKINTIENVLVRLIKYEHYFNLCSDHKGEFWQIVQNSIGESVCLFWCHIFGNRTDDFHYSQFFNKEAEIIAGADFSAGNVKRRMLSAMKISKPEYEVLWQEVKDCRDKFVSHKEHGASVIFPRIDLCRTQVEELRRILSEFVGLACQDQPESDWGVWHEYYAGQYLSKNQFKSVCEKEFRDNIFNLANELTSKGTGRDKTAPVL